MNKFPDYIFDKSFKLEYLLGISNAASRKQVARIIKLLESSIEVPLNKSLHDMNVNEFVIAIQNMDIISYAYLRVVISVARNYLIWLLKEHKILDSGKINAILLLDTYDYAISPAMKRCCFGSLEDFVSWIESFDLANVDISHIYRTICMLSWLGMTQEDMVNLKTSDIDFDNKTICCAQKTLSIPEEFVIPMKNFIGRKEHVQERRSRDGNPYLISTPYANSEYLFKLYGKRGEDARTSNEPRRTDFIGQRMLSGKREIKIKMGMDIRYDHSSITTSGKLYGIYTDEMNGGTITTDYLLKHCDLDEDMRQVSIDRKVKDLLYQYQQYKEAFHNK